MTPIGPSQIDGFEGEETTRFVRKTANGEIGLEDILIGKYQVTGKFYHFPKEDSYLNECLG